MGLRPGRIVREIKKPAWARFSKKKPRKSYVKSMPHNAIQVTIWAYSPVITQFVLI